MTTPRLLLISILLAALGPLATASAGAEERDEAFLERRLAALESRMAAPGTGLLDRQRQRLGMLERTMDKGDYRRFHAYVEREVIAPWKRVNSEYVMQLAASPPHQLSAQERDRLQRNRRLVEQINARLRRVRRLLTRLEKEMATTRRQHRELDQLEGRHRRLVGELEGLDAEAAQVHRLWIESRYRPQVIRLQERGRRAGDRVDLLLGWSEDPPLRLMLVRLQDVNRALDSLERRFGRGSLR